MWKHPKHFVKVICILTALVTVTGKLLSLYRQKEMQIYIYVLFYSLEFAVHVIRRTHICKMF